MKSDRTAASVPQPNYQGVIEKIPCDVVSNLIEFLDLTSTVKLATANKFFENYIYVKSKWIWVEVDFRKAPNHFTSKLTDSTLNAFLRKINAREVTKKLSLRGCSSITGSGLEPLRGSTVLEDIDLRVGQNHNATFGATCLDVKMVLSILSSMLVRNSDTLQQSVTSLSFVHFRQQQHASHYLDCFNEDIKEWLIKFTDVVEAKLKLDLIPCSQCKRNLVDTDTEDILKCRCMKCTQYTCQAEQCSSNTRCHLCQLQLCEACNDDGTFPTCGSCAKEFCGECRDVESCSRCMITCCGGCRTVQSCAMCEQSFCDGCSTLTSCDGCDMSYCGLCDTVSIYGEESRFCLECGASGTMSEPSLDLFSWCSVM